MNSQHIPPVVGTVGLLSTFTLGDANELVGLLVGLTTLVYLLVRIIKEIKNK